jgi:hypothetical protein
MRLALSRKAERRVPVFELRALEERTTYPSFVRGHPVPRLREDGRAGFDGRVHPLAIARSAGIAVIFASTSSRRPLCPREARPNSSCRGELFCASSRRRCRQLRRAGADADGHLEHGTSSPVPGNRSTRTGVRQRINPPFIAFTSSGNGRTVDSAELTRRRRRRCTSRALVGTRKLRRSHLHARPQTAAQRNSPVLTSPAHRIRGSRLRSLHVVARAALIYSDFVRIVARQLSPYRSCSGMPGRRRSSGVLWTRRYRAAPSGHQERAPWGTQRGLHSKLPRGVLTPVESGTLALTARPMENSVNELARQKR